MRISITIDPAGLAMLGEYDNSWTWYAKQKSLQPGVRVVAVTGEGDDWAAYLGPLDWPSLEVELSGDKMSEHNARQLFPWLQTKAGYRS